MRTDAYQARARELCVAAGIEPDSRIDRPGQRSMPAWCAYRDAARQEHVAAEAAKTAADIAIAPQAPQFQNSPLKVFGQHDENTLAQMKNCMAVGNVVAGVMCADGHLGYAQPVGADEPVKLIEYHTGGWSGAEDLIDAMLKQFWIGHFHTRWERGGHFYFKVNPGAFAMDAVGDREGDAAGSEPA